MKKFLILMGIGVGIFFAFKDNQLPLLSTVSKPIQNSGLKPDCQIKGNISISSGKKIYHVLGQEDYENTRIQPEHGERYFCTEEEARQAGWVKAPR